MTKEEYEQELIDCCIGRLYCELAKDLSDAELTRCLAPCVAGHNLVPLMQRYRDQGGDIPPKTLDRHDAELLQLMGRNLPYWATLPMPTQQELFAA
jgi:hypothetical protein